MKKEVPSPIFSNIPGTWANSTVSKRLPDIAGRVIEENHYPEDINQNLFTLQEDIKHHSIRHLLDQKAPDQRSWEVYVQPYLDQNWFDVPWFFTEHYFYRRIMEAVDYFKLNLDPFGYQKYQGLAKSKKDIQYLCDFLEGRIGDQVNSQETLKEGLYFSLWGNQADLSLWPAGSDSSPQHNSQQILQDHLLADHLPQIIELVCEGEKPLPRVDLLLDNAGFELITDLALVDILLGNNLVEQIVLQAKAHPTFVSDVIPGDVLLAINFLIEESDSATKSFGLRLQDYTRSGKLRTTSHFFWNSPLPMWLLPDDLEEEWKDSSLVISKGDANYRRLLGDRQWEMSLPFQQVVDFLPVPLAALRTLKAELAVGLDPDQIRLVAAQDPEWLVDGRWGVIHFAEGRLTKRK